MGLAVQPSGRVGKQHIDATRLRGFERIEDHRARIGAGLLGAEQRAGALGPDVQLLDRGGAESVAGGEHDTVMLLMQRPRELADARGLARSVHADDSTTRRPCGRIDAQRLLARA